MHASSCMRPKAQYTYNTIDVSHRVRTCTCNVMIAQTIQEQYTHVQYNTKGRAPGSEKQADRRFAVSHMFSVSSSLALAVCCECASDFSGRVEYSHTNGSARSVKYKSPSDPLQGWALSSVKCLRGPINFRPRALGCGTWLVGTLLMRSASSCRVSKFLWFFDTVWQSGVMRNPQVPRKGNF